jgi:hypothetical protein
MQCPRRLLPSSQRESEHTKETSTQQTEDRVSEGVRNPKAGYGCDIQENSRRKHNHHKIQGCHPSIGSSTHCACAVTQKQQERHRDNEREHEEQRCEKWNQRHPESLRWKGLSCRLCFLAFWNMRLNSTFLRHQEGTPPEAARRSLGSLLVASTACFDRFAALLNDRLEAPFHASSGHQSSTRQTKGLRSLQNVGGMGSTDCRRNARLARQTRV